MIVLHVGHDRRPWAQAQKHVVVLIRFDDKAGPLSGAPAGAQRKGRTPPTITLGSVSGRHQNLGHHARRRRLAVAAGNGDAVPPGHQLPQKVGPLENRDARLPRRHPLRVVRRHRRRDDQELGAMHVLRGVPLENGRPGLCQRRRHLALVQIRPRNAVPLPKQHPGDRRHAGTADPQQMYVGALRQLVHHVVRRCHHGIQSVCFSSGPGRIKSSQ